MAGGGILGSIGGAVGGITSTVLTRYKADTSDHKRKLKDLSGAQKKRMKETIKGLEEENRGLDKSIARYGKMAAGVAAVGAAYLAARESMRAYVKDSQLQNASAGISIDRLRKASHGLLTEMQLMQLAAAGVNNEWVATQEQLEAVANYTTVLYHKGNDLTETFNVMKKAIAEGGVEELQKFGEQLRGVSGNLAIKGEEGFNALMERANENLGEFAGIAGDDVVQASVRMDDALRDAKVSFGELAASMVPVVELLAKIAQGLALLGSKSTWDFFGRGGRDKATGRASTMDFLEMMKNAPGVGGEMWAMIDQQQRRIAGEYRADQGTAAWSQTMAVMGQIEEAKAQALAAAADRDARRRSGRGGAAGGGLLSGIGGRFGGSGGAGAWGPTGGYDFGALWGRITSPDTSPMRPTPFGADFDAAPSRGEMIGQQTDWQRIKKEYMPQMEEGAGMFAQSMQAAFAAVISGSGNAAQAFKQAMGQMLAAKATMLAGEAIYTGVMAIVNKDPSMGWAAAKAGAGAIALAAMARALGYGGNVPGIGAGAQAGGIKLGGTPGREGGTKVVILGDSFYGTGSSRQQAAQIRRVLADDSVIGS